MHPIYRILILFFAWLTALVSMHVADVLASVPPTHTLSAPAGELLQSQDVHGLQSTLTGDSLQGSSPMLQGPSQTVLFR